jgi:hypothetical protein
MTVRAGIVGLMTAFVLTGCGGPPEPPKPELALAADTIELADHWEYTPCQDLVFTLRSGATVQVVIGGITSPGCPEKHPTPQLMGDAGGAIFGAEKGESWRGDEAPLIFVGSDGDVPWFGSARRDDACWRVTFDAGEGAYLEAKSMHLVTGPVLALADAFATSSSDRYPLRSGDSVCLDVEGRVLSIRIPPIY